jgi:integrase
MFCNRKTAVTACSIRPYTRKIGDRELLFFSTTNTNRELGSWLRTSRSSGKPAIRFRSIRDETLRRFPQRSLDSYDYRLSKCERIFAERDFDSIGPDEIYSFLESQTHDLAKSTRRSRYAQLKAFCNFIINRCSLNMKHPCNASLLRKSNRTPKHVPRKMLEREMVDEMIYNTTRVRDRLILELQARCGLRIGELLKIKVSDISDRTIMLRTPKSGKESELAYMPENVSNKLAEYIKNEAIPMQSERCMVVSADRMRAERRNALSEISTIRRRNPSFPYAIGR